MNAPGAGSGNRLIVIRFQTHEMIKIPQLFNRQSVIPRNNGTARRGIGLRLRQFVLQFGDQILSGFAENRQPALHFRQLSFHLRGVNLAPGIQHTGNFGPDRTGLFIRQRPVNVRFDLRLYIFRAVG